jgi:ATP-dependent 26S proteasome regulatory subunit
MKMNRSFKPFTKFALFICLAFLFSNNHVYCQTNSDDSYGLKSSESKKDNEPAKGKHIVEIIGIIKDIPNEKKIVVRNDEGKEVTFYFKENLINDDFKIGDRVSVKFPLESFRQESNMSEGKPVSLSATGINIEKKGSDNNSQANSENLQKRESLQKESKKRKSFETEVRYPSPLTGLKMNKSCTISGDIAEIVSDENIVIKYEGRDILVKFRDKVASNLEVGDKVTVSCTPYREMPNGVILSKGTAIEKQE